MSFYFQPCIGQSSTQLTCTLPSLLGYGIISTPKWPARLHYGFIMDGVLPLLNVSFQPNFEPIQIYPNPSLTPLQNTVKYSDDVTLFIQVSIRHSTTYVCFSQCPRCGNEVLMHATSFCILTFHIKYTRRKVKCCMNRTHHSLLIMDRQM